MTEKQPNGLTYAQAGVDIDAGNAMVDRIKPLVRATRRPARAGKGIHGAERAGGFPSPPLRSGRE